MYPIRATFGGRCCARAASGLAIAPIRRATSTRLRVAEPQKASGAAAIASSSARV